MSRWVCLMYHNVGENPVYAGREFFSVSAATFAKQLDAIQALGYHGDTVENVVRAPRGDAGATQVAISFDDGDAGQFRLAFPELTRRGMRATFFVTTSWVGRSGFVSWEGLREMMAAGMSIQSHTHTHPFLSEVSHAELREELVISRAELERHLGVRTTSLALPGGDMPRSALRTLFAQEGYDVVATSRWGTNPRSVAPAGDVILVRRCTVRGAVTDSRFGRIVAGDRVLGVQRQLRELTLHAIRSSLGASRYASWRRRFLNAIRREPQP